MSKAKSGEMSDDMADFIKRKRELESKDSSTMDEKERKKEEIMKRVAERRKQRELEGSGSKAASAGISKLNEDLKRKDAEHQKEIFEMRKTIEELRKQVSELQASSRNAEKLQKEIQEGNEKFTNVQGQLNESTKQIESLNSEIATLKQTNETQRKEAQKERDVFKTDKAALDSEISNLRKQVESLSDLQKSESTADEKISQLTEELNDKNNEICLLKKSNELLNFEKDQLKSMLEEEQQMANERSDIISEIKQEYQGKVDELVGKNNKLVHEIKELREQLQELSSINSELREALDYEKSIVESQEVKLRNMIEQASAAPPSPSPVASKSAGEENSAESTTQQDNSRVRPSDSFEAALLGEINLLRKNPDAYADFLVDLIECYNGLSFKTRGSDHTFETKEGVTALEDAIEYLQSCSHSCPPLVLKDGLCRSAQLLCDQNGPTGSTDSTCADGTPSSERLVKYGEWKGRIMELMSFGPRAGSPRDVVTQWLIDDGNSARTQRTTLLDFDFKVAGVGSAPHSSMNTMTVLVLAKSYKDENDKSANDADEDDSKSSLNESKDGKFFVITSEPCRVPKSQVSLKLDGKVLHLNINGGEDDKGKKSSHQWNLPFGVPACNITAKYNECSEIEIYIDKRSREIKDGEQEIYSYDLPIVDVPNNRLKLQVVQKPDAIVFTTDPCSCTVNVAVKIIDGMILCFESVYSEKTTSETGSVVTKTVTRREKVNMPYTVLPDHVQFEKTDAQGMQVSVSKPSVENVVSQIPIA